MVPVGFKDVNAVVGDIKGNFVSNAGDATSDPMDDVWNVLDIAIGCSVISL